VLKAPLIHQGDRQSAGKLGHATASSFTGWTTNSGGAATGAIIFIGCNVGDVARGSVDPNNPGKNRSTILNGSPHRAEVLSFPKIICSNQSAGL
jgi:hypothetical protein